MIDVIDAYFPDIEALRLLAEECKGNLLGFCFGDGDLRHLRVVRVDLRRTWGDFARSCESRQIGLFPTAVSHILEAYDTVLEIGRAAMDHERGGKPFDLDYYKGMARDAIYDHLILDDNVEFSDEAA